ncbi:MAG: hypothetical protein ACI9LO_001659 [Planctomycetota bacterium]|jgi:hypothetical protein
MVLSWITTRHDSIGKMMRNLSRQFFEQGWCRFEHDPGLGRWVESALEPAGTSLINPAFSHWHRCANTWFAGVNVLANRGDGSLTDGVPLQGQAIDFVDQVLNLQGFDWDAGQVSVCFPGYPRPMDGETVAAANYRRKFDAAHLDGLLPEGDERRRHLREHHGFILGIPLVDFSAEAAPFVVWERSHELVRCAFGERLSGIDAELWGEEDLTDFYHTLRRQIFESCKRVEIHARPGEAFIAHRLLLHGIAPWGKAALAGPYGRMICYFRPEIPGPESWLNRR